METISITTPVGKHEVKLKSYITGRDSKAINGVLFEGMDISAVSSRLDGGQLQKMNDKSVEIVVVEIDGKTEDLMNTLEDMHAEDYNYVLSQVQSVVNYKDEDKKK